MSQVLVKTLAEVKTEIAYRNCLEPDLYP
jgi:hypothetical protein